MTTGGKAQSHGSGHGTRFGVNAKLQAAFGAVAMLTVTAALVAITSFAATERGFEYVSGHEVPVMTDALRLSAISGEISAAAARLAGAKTEEEQEPIRKLIAEKRDRLAAIMQRLQAGRGMSRAFSAVEANSERLRSNLVALEVAIAERSERRRELEETLTEVHRLHALTSEKLTPIVDDSYFDAAMTAEAIGKSGDRALGGRIDRQIVELRNALEIAVQTHLVATLMSEAATVREKESLKPMEDRFRSAADALQRASAPFANSELEKLVGLLVKPGQGRESLFDMRRHELDASRLADQTIEDNVRIQGDLDQAVSALVGEAESGMKQGIVRLVEDLRHNRILLLVVALASVAAAVLISILYVRRRLVRRLTSIGDAMHRLSSGDTEVEVPAVGDRDELGEMGRALEVFRAGEIERRGFAERQRAEQVAQRARATSIEQMIGDFRATVTAVIAAVADNVSRMEATARTLSSIAAEADQQARAASASSATTSSNVRGVAGAAEELGASIVSISAQATQANGVVDRAAAIAQSANQQIGQLTEGASRIGDVVKLIRAIAEQTNLLALNATIESARAGEAGRGFAVVAAEVKTLATQTAKATEEIAAQVGAIQGSTADAVEAIRSIGEVMDEITRFTATIAAAVEQQSSSTHSIARNVQEAATGARELAGNMATVSEAIDETNRAASAVLDASGALTAQSGTLQSAVDAFLDGVAAA